MARSRITIQIEDDLIKELKLKIIERGGDPQKGDMSLKIEEAIRLWLEKFEGEKPISAEKDEKIASKKK
jgi:hypothetical protein